MDDLRFEHHRDAQGFGTGSPRLSWTVLAEYGVGWQQTAYEVGLTASEGGGPTAAVTVESPDCVRVSWPFDPLPARARAIVRVRATGADGTVTGWSDPAAVEVGLVPSNASPRYAR